MNIAELFNSAMVVQTQSEATACFAKLVELHVLHLNRLPEEAPKEVLQNIAVWAGFKDEETRDRVKRLFNLTDDSLQEGIEAADEIKTVVSSYAANIDKK